MRDTVPRRSLFDRSYLELIFVLILCLGEDFLHIGPHFFLGRICGFD